MKNKLLTKMMMVALIISSMFLISACSLIKKDLNIEKIEIVEETIPEKILIGEFNNAGIKLEVTYDDNSTEQIDVTKDFIPNEYQNLLEKAGSYDIQILFRGFTTSIHLNIVQQSQYTVNFYDAYGKIISTQEVVEGEDAIIPSDELTNLENYTFVSWDRDFANVTENINVYGIYVRVINSITSAELEEKLENAENYFKTTDHYSVLNSTHKTTYHYDKETRLAESQTIFSNNGSFAVTNFYNNKYEYYILESNGYEVYNTNSITDCFADLSETEKMNTILFGNNSIPLSAEYEGLVDVEYSYELYKNKALYTCKITVFESDGFTSERIYTYDNEKLLQININYYNTEDVLTMQNEIIIDYLRYEFDDTIIPSNVK